VRRLAWFLLRLRVMLTEGLCDHCGHVLFATSSPELDGET
jgi:hypothetical protein